MNKEKDPDMRKQIEPAPPADTGNLVQAAKLVYKRYGTNLTKFFRDAEAEEQKEREREHVNSTNLEVCP